MLLEKLVQKNEVRAGLLIDQVEQLPEGEKLARKVVDMALSEEGGRRRKKEKPAAAGAGENGELPALAPGEQALAAPVVRHRVNPGKVKMVADLLGLADLDEEEILVRLIDEFLALNSQA